MAKKSVIERQKKREMLVKKYYLVRNDLKFKIKNAKSFEEKLFYYFKIQKLPRDSSNSRIM